MRSTRKNRDLWSINNKKEEKAVLIGIDFPKSTISIEESLSELYQLARTAGAKVAGKFVQSRAKPHPSLYFGKGKVEQVKSFINQEKLNLVIVDDELNPTQERNLEEKLGCKVVDRTRLILDIFALHASSSVGKMQVELAQMEYFLPRLKNIWTEFSRLGGGIGTRGPGEKKIEVDRRIINDRIAAIKSKLEKISHKRKDIRKLRKKTYKKNICFVGYTNAGKSTLMNTLTDSHIGVADKLFSTLSPKTNRVKFEKYEILLTDTVGFIRKLPHQVVRAFMATLEQVKEADLLYHVIDISSDNYRHQMNAVSEVLNELDVKDKPTIRVYNKIDKVSMEPRIQQGKIPSVFISAITNTGLDKLKKETVKQLDEMLTQVTLRIPQKRQDIINVIYKSTHIIDRSYEKNDVLLKCRADERLISRYKDYII